MAGISRLLVLLVAVSVGTVIGAQNDAPQQHRIVFQVTADGADHWESVLTNVDNVQAALGADRTQIEIVVHSGGLGMLMSSNEQLQQRMQKMSQAGVVFSACENTMKRKGVTREQLLPFVGTVDSGVAQVVRRQQQGWSYVRS